MKLLSLWFEIKNFKTIIIADFLGNYFLLVTNNNHISTTTSTLIYNTTFWMLTSFCCWFNWVLRYGFSLNTSKKPTKGIVEQCRIAIILLTWLKYIKALRSWRVLVFWPCVGQRYSHINQCEPFHLYIMNNTMYNT